MIKKKKVITGGLLLCVIIVCIWGVWKWKRNEKLAFVENMGAGFNLGNSLDATNPGQYQANADELEYETFWNNPRITQEQFHAIREAGYGTVRIPVTWEDHLDENGIISKRWLNRVTEVIDMALAEGLYVIVNTHHEKWLTLELENETAIEKKFITVWTQLAEHFATYDEHLLFEGMNEPRLRDSEHEWDGGTPKLQQMVNRLNQIFIDTVRSTGENNKLRYLLIQPYGGSEKAIADVVVPKGNTIVSVHMYYPYEFCQKEDGPAQWLNAEEDIRYIDDIMQEMNELYIRKGIPVMITEYGCTDKDNLSEREAWTENFVKSAGKYNISCIWWDNGSTYQLLDRENNSWKYPTLVERTLE